MRSRTWTRPPTTCSCCRAARHRPRCASNRLRAPSRRISSSGKKPVAAICHGPQILAAADLLRGRQVTCVASVAPEIKAAGADDVDREVVVDANLITSRTPDDLPAFLRETMRAIHL